MPALTHRGYLQMVKESAWGTNPGTGYVATAIQSEALKNTPKVELVKSIRATRDGANIEVPMEFDAGGPITFEADVEGILGLLLKGILPSETFSDLGAGNGGSHTFVLGDTLPSFSVLINRDTTPDAANIWQALGCTVDKLSLSCATGGLLKAVATLSAQKVVPAATGAAPTFTTQPPLAFHQAVVTVFGTMVNCKSWQLDLVGSNFNKRLAMGTRYIQQQQPGLMNATLKTDLYFDSLAAVTAFQASTVGAIDINLLGSTLGSSTRRLDLLLPTVVGKGDTPVLSGPGQEIMLPMSWDAFRSGSGSPDALVQAILLNSQRAAY